MMFLTPYSECPQGSYIPPSDDQILEMVVRTVTENKILGQSADDITARVRSPVIEGSSTSAEDIPERAFSPVVRRSSTVDRRGHEVGTSRDDGVNTNLFQNNDMGYHPKSRQEKHSSEMGKLRSWNMKPAAEDMEEDLYSMTPSPVQMTLLSHEEALTIAGLQKGRSDVEYEDVSSDESPQMEITPHKRGESILKPSCKCQETLVENDDGDFVCQPCPACVRQKELQNMTRDTKQGIDEMREELIADESQSVSAHANDFYESETETEDEQDDWIVIGPIAISSLKYVRTVVGSKSSPAPPQLEVFDNMESFKEAKAKLLGISSDHIQGVEVHQSNTGSSGTAAPKAPARCSPPIRPQRSPQHSAEKGDYSLPLSPESIVTSPVMDHSSDSSNDSDILERKVDQRKVKRRKLSKSKNVVSDYSKSKAEHAQQHNNNKPADCQKRGSILPEIEREPCTQQYNSSETENSSDCSMSPPPQRNRLTCSSLGSKERSNPQTYNRSISNSDSGVHDNNPQAYNRSISNSDSGVHDNSATAASSPLRRSMSLEPEMKRQKIQNIPLKTVKTCNENKQAKNQDDKESGSGGYCPELTALKLDKSRIARIFSPRSIEATVNSVCANVKPSYSRQSSAVTKANSFKPEEVPSPSKEGLPAFVSSGIREKLKQHTYDLYSLSQNGVKLPRVETNEDKLSTVAMPRRRISHIPASAPGQKRKSHESAPGQGFNSHESTSGTRRNSHEYTSGPIHNYPEYTAGPRRNFQESTSGPRRNCHESATRRRHRSHENPLLKKTIAEARGETKRKATKIAQQSGPKDGSKEPGHYKWKDLRKNPRLSPEIDLEKDGGWD